MCIKWLVKPLSLLLVAVTGCMAQQLTVRVVNGKNDQPLKSEKVVVQFSDSHPNSPSITVQTDGNGEVHFSLPNPAPDYVDVHVFLKSERWHCGCWVFAQSTSLVKEGIVQYPATKMREGVRETVGKPREIVFVARPFTLLDNLLYPLVKE